LENAQNAIPTPPTAVLNIDSINTLILTAALDVTETN